MDMFGNNPMKKKTKEEFYIKALDMTLSMMPSPEFQERVKRHDETMAVHDILNKLYAENLEAGQPRSYGDLVEQAQKEHRKNKKETKQKSKEKNGTPSKSPSP